MTVAALEVRGLAKVFGGIRAVDGVSLEVAAGERRVIIGPNGAGKTTLFHCITGTLPPSAGAVSIFGTDVTRMPEHRRTALGIARTFQISNVFADLTVGENVALALVGTSGTKWVVHRPMDAFDAVRDAARRALALVGLEARIEQTVHHLSYGERRQLELALAIARRPRLVFLDEPCAGLSPAERRRLFSLIAGLEREITILMIEHDMDVALGLADRVTVLHRGAVILEGSPDDVRVHPEVREVYFGQR
jgi:branched-chain amino acid transport system ATP-binding protein